VISDWKEDYNHRRRLRAPATRRQRSTLQPAPTNERLSLNAAPKLVVEEPTDQVAAAVHLQLPSPLGFQLADGFGSWPRSSWIYAASCVVVTPSSKLPERPPKRPTYPQDLSPPWTAGHLLGKEGRGQMSDKAGMRIR
jgi:hypothetical protein